MANYLVTGGAGFIGSNIVKRLLEKGECVRVVDNLSTGKEERLYSVRSSIDFLQADLADPATCDKAVQGIDYVLHQAAIPSVQRSVEDPLSTNRANITATLNLLESSRKQRVRRVVFAASSSAYGNAETLPKHEKMEPNPCSPYALQKLVGERYCRLYHDLFGLETVSLRYFNVFGPDQDPDSEYSAVIPKFIMRLLWGKTLVVYGDGEQSRDFTYIDNVVHANLLALAAKEAPGKVFNVGCGERISLNQLIGFIEAIVGKKAEVEHADPRQGDVRHSLAAIVLAEQILGYKPQVTTEEGLRRTVEAFSVARRRTAPER
ncbi:MAG: SDR family oxidoreductase [Candidatus Binatia bacterium]